MLQIMVSMFNPKLSYRYLTGIHTNPESGSLSCFKVALWQPDDHSYQPDWSIFLGLWSSDFPVFLRLALNLKKQQLMWILSLYAVQTPLLTIKNKSGGGTEYQPVNWIKYNINY